ncbi:hypothetical protein HI914_05023 [Erysiphe necator]|nr:hypothetical protein HI914_05023 [Erysiphe necator]
MLSLKPNINDPKYGTFRIGFTSKEAKPPVFIAGTFTNPPWQPLKMESFERKGPDEYKFEIRLDLPRGQDYQYKFRLGREDHWNLNEEEPIVKDEAGNRNNLLPTERNKYGWRERKKVSNQGEEVLEERVLTKFTAEERQKTLETLVTKNQQSVTEDTNLKTDLDSSNFLDKNRSDNNQQQSIQQLTSHTEDLRKYISDIKVTDTGIMVPEVPRDPAPTPANLKPFNGLAEINYEDLKQNNKSLLSNGSKTNRKLSSRESFKKGAKNELDTPEKGSETRYSQQMRNIDIANTAAEVADTAVILDQEPSSPPISDTEAGQIGLRCLSTTPIAEVASVAAEVADVAASLDNEQATGKTSRQLLDENAERLFGSGHTTPVEERVPRFSHEFPTFQDPSGPRKSQSDIFIPSLPKREEIPDNLDLNDPSIELFPTDRASILAKLKEIQERLPEDEAHFESLPKPSVVLPEDWSMNDFDTVSPKIFNSQLTKSLQPITEEEDSKSQDSHSQEAITQEKSSIYNGHTSEVNDLERTKTKTIPNGKMTEDQDQEENLNEMNSIQNRPKSERNKQLSDESGPYVNQNGQKALNDKSFCCSTKIESESNCKPETESHDSSTQSLLSFHDNDLTSPNQEQEKKSENYDSNNTANFTKSQCESDMTCKNKSKPPGISNGVAKPICKSKISQKIDSDDKVTPKNLQNIPRDSHISSFLDLVWRLLLLDWIGNIINWFWGSRKHDT